MSLVDQWKARIASIDDGTHPIPPEGSTDAFLGLANIRSVLVQALERVESQ